MLMLLVMLKVLLMFVDACLSEWSEVGEVKKVVTEFRSFAKWWRQCHLQILHFLFLPSKITTLFDSTIFGTRQ